MSTSGTKSAKAATAPKAVAAKPSPAKSESDSKPASAWDKENPKKLSGVELQAFAHRQGMAKSELAKMTDEKIRIQLHHITARRYADDDAMV